MPITTCWRFARVSSGATVALKCSRDVTSDIERDGHVITDATDEFGIDRTSEYLPVAGFQEVRIEYFSAISRDFYKAKRVLREFDLAHKGSASAIERICGLGAVLMKTRAERQLQFTARVPPRPQLLQRPPSDERRKSHGSRRVPQLCDYWPASHTIVRVQD